MLLAAAIAVACVALPAIAQAAFPGTPGESPRLNTPNDPDFDRCEPTTAPPDSSTAPHRVRPTEEDYRLFGFSPDSALVAPGVHTPYVDCAQLDARGQGRERRRRLTPPCSQIGGHPRRQRLEVLDR